MAFFLRLRYAPQAFQEALTGVHPAEIQRSAGKGRLHLVSLVLAEQPVVDKNAGKLPADGLAQKRRQH